MAVPTQRLHRLVLGDTPDPAARPRPAV